MPPITGLAPGADTPGEAQLSLLDGLTAPASAAGEDARLRELDAVASLRGRVQGALDLLLSLIREIQIGRPEQFPFGWAGAGKGRTVWRIVEEVVRQNLLATPARFGLAAVGPPESEVGVWDLRLTFPGAALPAFINVKTSTRRPGAGRDDVSKARGLVEFLSKDHASLFIATIGVSFLPDMKVGLAEAHVAPVAWVPEIYVNPSNGNLQSALYGATEIPRTVAEFLQELARGRAL